MKVAETKITHGRITTVPAPIRAALNLREGDSIEWHVVNERVEVRKKIGDMEK